MESVKMEQKFSVKIKYKLTADESFAEVEVSFDKGSHEWTLEANFVPLEQREFVDALDRALPFELIVKNGHGGCIIQGPMPEGMTRAGVMERIEAVFADTIV
jgi:hypothetical protein